MMVDTLRWGYNLPGAASASVLIVDFSGESVQYEVTFNGTESECSIQHYTDGIQYCKKDIEIADEFVAEFGEVRRIPSFKRLAIIYEKQERYSDAIAVCDQALEIGTTDGTKGDFEGRKDRLRKKLNDE